ncbi:MAG: DUF1858 domain-containing protein [Armatimonadota bacterium]
MRQVELTNEMSLREVLAAYPQTRAVMERYGLMECGGSAGPDEPLGWFARVHQVDPERLKNELREAIAAGGTETESAHAAASAPATGPDPDGLFRLFLPTAIIFVLTGGVLWGAINLSMIGYHHQFLDWLIVGNQAHGHVQIFGWVALFIMGVAYHVIPRLKAAPLQHVSLGYASFWLMAGGVLLHAFYRPFMANAALAPIAVFAGVMELAAALAFTIVIVATMRKGTTGADLSDKYLVTGTIGLVLMTAMNVLLLSTMAARGTAALPEQWNWAYRHLQLDGFIAFFIFGVSLRTLPVFLGKPEPNALIDRLVFPLLVISLLLRATGEVLVQYGLLPAGALAIPGTLELVAVLGFIGNLGVFKRTIAPPEGMSADARAYEKYLYAAYGWLVIATLGIATMTYYTALTGNAAPHALMGSYRHALTVGFITFMILGYSMRTIPVFLGRPMFSVRLLNATFVLMMVGNTLRVVFQGLTVPFGAWPFAVAGMSGWFEMVGLALFGYNLLRTIFPPEAAPAPATGCAVETEDGPVEISETLTVARLLDAFPQTLPVLLELGFEPLANPMLRATLAKRITLEAAANIKHIPVEELMRRLRDAVPAPTG